MDTTFYNVSFEILIGDIEREKKQYQQYVARIDDWKNLKLALAIQQHKYVCSCTCTHLS